MKWLTDFAASQPVAYAVLILAGVAISGLAIGQIRVRGIRLGVAGVLFAGIFSGITSLRCPPRRSVSSGISD